MSLIPTIYSSDDPGAPQLSGTVGSMISVLRALLVTGYGTAPNDKAGLGWTEEFAGTNKAVFRNNPVSGSGSFLRVLDDGTPVGGARMAQLHAYESMTGVDTGSGMTPSGAEQPSGSLWVKSTALSSTARPWWAIGNERVLYLFVSWYNTNGVHPFFAGDILSDKPADAFGFVVMGAPHHTDFAGEFSKEVATCFVLLDYGRSIVNSSRGGGGYALRAGDGVTASKRVYNVWPGVLNSPTLDSCYGRAGAASNLPIYPDPISGGYRYCECLIGEDGGSRAIRGRFPGVYGLMHSVPFGDLEAIPVAPGMPAGAAVLSKTYWTGNYVAGGLNGQVIFLTGVPWQ